VEVDSRDFSEAVCTDPEDIYKYMTIELDRDTRRNNIKGDLQERYNNYRSWRNTRMSQDVDKAVALVPSDGNTISAMNNITMPEQFQLI